MFLQVLASVFVVELGVMWLLPLFRPLSPGVTMLVDAGLLALGCAPILWWVVAAPLRAAAEGDRARAALLQGVLDGSIDAIVTVDAHQRVVIFSTGAEQLFGWRADEIIGQPLSVLLPDRVREAHAGHVAGFQRSSIRHKAMQQRTVVAARRKDGTEVHVEASLSKVISGGALYMTAIVRDVTQREAAEEELRASVEPSDGMLVVVIQDTGIGIAAENLPRLFHPFEQLEGGVARRFGGSGLGLALSARLAEQQGGTIAVESALGAGSTFTVRIPVEIPDSTN